jgi:hypothetical protein
MTWGGMSGTVFRVDYDQNGIGVAKKCSDLALPYNINMLKLFKPAVTEFFNYKASYENRIIFITNSNS